jgi:HK97 family phage major capsid protein
MVGSVTQAVDNAIINGNEPQGPQGVLSAPCTIDVARATASTIAYADIISMYERLHPTMIPGAVWIGAPAIMSQLCTIADAAGRNIWQPSASGGVAGPTPGSLFGLPLMISDKCPTLGTRGDLQLVNFGYYAFGMRKGATVESTNAHAWTQDLASFRVLMRCDGNFLLDNPITPANGGDTLSCAVVLQ